MMNDIRMMYNDLRGVWICQTPRMLEPIQLKRVCQFTLNARGKMAASMPPGDRKDRVVTAIENLRAGKVEQAILNEGRNETTLYSKD
jgi:hypothetical protein